MAVQSAAKRFRRGFIPRQLNLPALAGKSLSAIPPKYAVSQVIGFIKGKSAIHLARVYGERRRNFTGQHFWARGYFVSTVGRDEAVIRDYIRRQEEEDRRLDQLNFWPDEPPSGGTR